jgi:hypothetical protein
MNAFNILFARGQKTCYPNLMKITTMLDPKNQML